MNRRASGKERDLAEQLLLQASRQSHALSDLPSAVDRVVDQQFQRFRDLIGTDGISALLTRALYLARSEAPFLRQVELVESQLGVRLSGLRESMEGVDEDQARRGYVELIANLIWLLVTFLGERLALRTIQATTGESPSQQYPTTLEGESP